MVESVVQDRKQELPLELLQALTEDSFSPALAKAGHVVVLFYASCKLIAV